ncbi:MAG: PAS domain-containing protein [Cyanophyceae cyanobacterium]
MHYAHETLRFHLYNSPLAAIEWDSQFRVAHWSPQAKALFGWREKEVVGLHPTEWSFVVDEDVAAVDQILNQLLSYETDSLDRIRQRDPPA